MPSTHEPKLMSGNANMSLATAVASDMLALPDISFGSWVDGMAAGFPAGRRMTDS